MAAGDRLSSTASPSARAAEAVLPATSGERIHSLDILRGFALLGMFIVHFHVRSTEPGGLDDAVRVLIWRLVETKSHGTFALLFGAGFAIQLRRAGARGLPFGRIYLRRLAVLALFGIAAHAFFGFNVLFGYAVWGVALLLIRTWSTRALLVTALLSAISVPLYHLSYQAYLAIGGGSEAIEAAYQARRVVADGVSSAVDAAEAQESFKVLLAARLSHMAWFYRQPFFFMPGATLALFITGFLFVRHRVFEDTLTHTRLLAIMAAFGIVSWLAGNWLVDRWSLGALGLFFRDQWLTFTYVGAALSSPDPLAAPDRSPAPDRRCRPNGAHQLPAADRRARPAVQWLRDWPRQDQAGDRAGGRARVLRRRGASEHAVARPLPSRPGGVALADAHLRPDAAAAPSGLSLQGFRVSSPHSISRRFRGRFTMRLRGSIMPAALLLAAALPATVGTQTADEPATQGRTVRPVLRGTQYAVSSMKPEATAAAVRILEAGGNAFDAIVAGQAVLSLVDFASNGIGGDAQILLYDAKTRQVSAINAEGTAPRLATIEWYEKNNGAKLPDSDGLLAASTPGVVDAWYLLLDRWGTMTFEQVLQPAIETAELGFPLSEGLARGIAGSKKIRKYPTTMKVYLPTGVRPKREKSSRTRMLARLLKKLVEAEKQRSLQRPRGGFASGTRSFLSRRHRP